MSEADGKAKVPVWTRWAVTVQSVNPTATHDLIAAGLVESDRFVLRSMGPSATSVWLVVEYTARGANGDDIKRRIEKAGVARSAITARKIATVEAELRCNADVIALVRGADPD